MIFVSFTSNSMRTGTIFAVDFYTRPYWSISAITKTIGKKLITSLNRLDERHVFTLQNFPNNLTDIYLVFIFVEHIYQLYLFIYYYLIKLSWYPFFIHINLSNYLKQHLSLIHIDEFHFSYNIEIGQKIFFVRISHVLKCHARK